MNGKLKELLLDAGVFSRYGLTKEEASQIPEGELHHDEGGEYYIHNEGLTNEEINTMLLAKQTLNIKTIKNILVFYLIVSLLAAGITLYFASTLVGK